MKIRHAITLSFLLLPMVACSPEPKEASRLGFASVDEMHDIQTKGWHTKYQYLADESARATKHGFASADELHAAEAAGYTEKAAYDQYKVEEAARDAQKDREKAQQIGQKADDSSSSSSAPNESSDNMNEATALDKQYGTKAEATCGVEADDYLRSIAKHDFAWDDDAKGFFGVKFGSFRKQVDAPGVITYVSDKAKLQNGFGAWNHVTLLCHYNTTTDKATFDTE